MASAKKEETDLWDLLKDLAKNWKIMVPCIFVSGIIGVFIAFWIRPVYKVDALLQIESKSNKSVGMNLSRAVISLAKLLKRCTYNTQQPQ